jgi:DNA-binding response OmpR family regulator
LLQEAIEMKKLRVLLVDDEQEFVETLADRLKMRDLETSTAHNGREALSAVKQGEPDVIVLDLKMPGIHGIEVLKRVKEAYPNVEVIILTGHGSEKDEQAARDLGAFDYLRKPANLEALVSRIKNAFQRRMKKLERISIAATFAEAGEPDMAREILEEKNKKDD